MITSWLKDARENDTYSTRNIQYSAVDKELPLKVSLISPYPDVTAIGVRILSACLRQAGHETQVIMLRDPFGDNVVAGAIRYSEKVIGMLVELCRDSDLIGVSLMTNFFDNAVEIDPGYRKGHCCY